MNALVSDQDRAFVEEMVLSGDPLYATMRAGIREAGVELRIIAQKMIDRPDIQAAIAELKRQNKYAQPIEITNRSIAEDMERVYDAAFSDKDWKAAISAKSTQAQMLGLLVSKVEITRVLDVTQMSDAQLAAIAAGSAAVVIDGESERVENSDPGTGGG